VFLVLWEILPRAHLINPLFTSYPSAIWPTFLDMLKETPQQPGILTHTWATVVTTVVAYLTGGHTDQRISPLRVSLAPNDRRGRGFAPPTSPPGIRAGPGSVESHFLRRAQPASDPRWIRRQRGVGEV